MLAEKEQQELKLRLLEEHLTDPHPDLEGPRLRLHVALHMVVELQLMDGTPPQTAAALKQLVAQGMSRHEAVHSIAEVVSDVMAEFVGQGHPFDEEYYVKRLGDLTSLNDQQKN